ncbi:DUF333 domain-containing protein, partial [Candidatus Woesearchaeota archaeon]|nr:DUF333 domain-containing protein [Candidatus Woesearchaeota archaeon]
MRYISKVGTLLFLLVLLTVVGCETKESATSGSKIANPASVYCEEQGYQLEIRTDPDGG